LIKTLSNEIDKMRWWLMFYWTPSPDALVLNERFAYY